MLTNKSIVATQLTGTVAGTKATCANNDGKITITATGGSGAYTYMMNNVAYYTNVLTGLAPGTYYVSIQDQNNPSCTINKTITIGKDCITTPVTSCVKINAFVFLEGAHSSAGSMHTSLNDKGYL